MLRAAPLHGRIDFYSTPDRLLRLIRYPNAYESNLFFNYDRTISLEGPQ